MENALLNFFSCVAPALFQSHATFYNNNNFQDTYPFLRRNFHVKTPTRTTKISSQQNQSHMSPLSLCYAYIYLNAFRFPNGKKEHMPAYRFCYTHVILLNRIRTFWSFYPKEQAYNSSVSSWPTALQWLPFYSAQKLRTSAEVQDALWPDPFALPAPDPVFILHWALHHTGIFCCHTAGTVVEFAACFSHDPFPNPPQDSETALFPWGSSDHSIWIVNLTQ